MRTIALLAIPAWVAARCADPPDPDDLWSISPAHPTTTDDLAVVFADDPSAIRGLAVTVTWRNGGRSFTGLTLPASETTRGEVWRVEVAATRRGKNAVDHGRVTIENAPPSLPIVTVTPESPLERSDSIRCAATAGDPDGDPVTMTYAWTVNGAPWGEGEEVPFEALAAHDRWTCTATANDGLGGFTSASADAGPVAEALGLSLIRLEAGTTMQGLDPALSRFASGGLTQVEVTLTRPFLLGSHELTQALFEETMGYNNSLPLCAECPVQTLTWHEAAAYTNTISRAAGLQECFTCTGAGTAVSCTQSEPYPCLGYRIPTYAEYNHAARLAGASTGPWPTGAQPARTPTQSGCVDHPLEDGSRLSDYMWGCFNTTGVQPVGTRLPNPMGFFDLSGNVTEWTAMPQKGTWSQLAVDPWIDSPETNAVVFGGKYWSEPSHDLLIGVASAIGKANQSPSVGFRLARTLPH
jgi:formylglycine-generating enzyme required for sulfatase activity